MSEPKHSLNLIKINKHKLPVDFFPRKDLSARRTSFKSHGQQELEPSLIRKVESERLGASP